MNFLDKFSQSDFFNYYLSGIIWLIFLIMIVPESYRKFFTEYSANPFLKILLLLIIPYILGFTLLPISEYITRLIRPDFKKIALGFENKKGYKKLAKPFADKGVHMAEKLFEEKLNDKSLYFWWIRAYIWKYNHDTVNLAKRAQALANLAESLLIPVPLLGWLISYRIISNLWNNKCLGFVFSFGVAIGLWFCLIKRYLKLREYYVIHTYRAFVILSLRK